MDQAEREAGFAKVQDWLTQYADKITHNRKLASAQTATTVRLSDGGDPIVIGGVPERPDAWLFTVARRRGLDVLRREARYRDKLAQLQWPVAPEPDDRSRTHRPRHRRHHRSRTHRLVRRYCSVHRRHRSLTRANLLNYH
ncbi:hypothetical protein LWC34_17470 [Kibdelosporangium philippinense]|uniref:Uncharacterized protein n=1 Tax=Kibdelosporangium philippinense TaxID=211113 RepID=A0ABS8ZCM5_9PSEU|nr:hypothetical protein [Kibdelosporangium philippinense]MCE7004600.1 hypothetical protein [Kibdelosporangium philippinense]